MKQIKHNGKSNLNYEFLIKIFRLKYPPFPTKYAVDMQIMSAMGTF